MHELAVAEFERVRPLFQHIDYHRPAVFTVLEGRGGRVFVDQREKPSAALILFDSCYLAGSAANTAFNAALPGLLRTDMMPRRENLLIFTFADPWRDVLDELLREDGVKRIVRTGFDLNPALFQERHHAWRTRIPGGYVVRRIDAEIVSQVHGLADLWGSNESFLARGFGFCALRDGKVISSCQTVFVADGHAETGVNTEESYRRQGLATLVGCAYLEHCLASDIRPVWQCFYNDASANLAQKLGFVNRREAEVMWVHVPEAMRQPRPGALT
jgi:hypothetical protein